uniref:Uncharacterized protein n=1 Tax=Rhizophora mucronata TaxID=61149 RepID=A0A2P2QJT6_RHIMU
MHKVFLFSLLRIALQ